MFEIEKGIPRKSYNGIRDRLPIDKMEIGDSFFVSNTQVTGGIRAAARAMARTLNMEIESRKEESGIRIWRIA